MLIQAIGPSTQGTKEYTPVLLEFKVESVKLSQNQKNELKVTPTENKELKEKELLTAKGKEIVEKLTIEQKNRYTQGAAIKAMTDSNNVVIMGVLFNIGAKNADTLIFTSESFTPAVVVHSSTTMIAKEKHLEELKKLINKCKNMGIQEENLNFLESATENHNYKYWLQEHDIADIARIEYGYGTNMVNTLFHIGSPEHLPNQLSQLRNVTEGATRRLTLIVNLNNLHWVTLVIFHQNSRYNIYYVDSFGQDIPESISQALQQNDISIININIMQQKDGHNCGLWALENARNINVLLDELDDRVDSLSVEKIQEKLKIIRNEEYFINLRNRFSEQLIKDPMRVENLKNILAENETQSPEHLKSYDMNKLLEETVSLNSKDSKLSLEVLMSILEISRDSNPDLTQLK